MAAPKNEDQLWAMAYAVAASFLTLGTAIAVGPLSPANVKLIDERAADIATAAQKRLKDRL